MKVFLYGVTMFKQKFNARVLTAVVAAALGVGVASSAGAGTATQNLSVTASVTANCTISTAAVAFGAYDPVVTNATAALNGTGTVSVTCTNGATTAITLGQGTFAGTGSTDALPVRRLNDGGADYLSYTLYSDTGRTTIWGNTSGTSVAHTGTGLLTAITVYGAVAAGQNVPPGSYTDTVVATITF
jgi:spore coat protein U-like protein